MMSLKKWRVISGKFDVSHNLKKTTSTQEQHQKRGQHHPSLVVIAIAIRIEIDFLQVLT